MLSRIYTKPLIMVFLLMLLGCLGQPSPPKPATPTPEEIPANYVILLNVFVYFEPEGVAVVEMRQHPVSSIGEDLWPVQALLIENLSLMEDELILESCSLFSVSKIENLTYIVLEGLHVENETTTYYDKDGDGVFDPYRGAWVTKIAVLLDKAPYTSMRTSNIYEVLITDFYTKQNPVSWIDLVNISWGGGVKLLGYSVIPENSGKPRTNALDEYLLWENSNSLEAPDGYLLELWFPRFAKYTYRLREVGAEILGVETGFFSVGERGELTVKVKNTGEVSGDFIVTVKGASKSVQARVIYLRTSEASSLVFPFLAEEKGAKEIEVKVYYENQLLDLKKLFVRVS